ncbi:hypothetical protein PG996_011818 [Apiospora saccharicola]|uniref:Uncharacterized protein n=1 Tax=Apiospora saccharicola TaxID=335842 RepID=A0ABR1UG36_9PEZI
MPVIPVNFPTLNFPSFTIPPITFPDITGNITITPELAQAIDSTLTKDDVVAGLADLGLTRGWVVFLQIVLVVIFSFFAIFFIAACVAGCTDAGCKKEMQKQKDLEEGMKEFREFKKFQRLQASVLDLEKGQEKAKYETTGHQSDAASFKTCAE